MDKIFYILQLSSIIGMSYVGWRSKDYIKSLLNTPYIKPYKNKLAFNPKHTINENNFCGLIGSLSGMFIGRIAWPIALPISLLVIEKDYGSDIKMFINSIRNIKKL